MGKSKQVAQRTKGNVKASSSGRAADVLGAAVGVIGFEALSAVGPTDAGDTDLSSEWKLMAKKLSKKDGVTRLKGLQELASLVTDGSEEELCAFLPQWPKFFSKSALDHDRRVRETSQVVHQKIVIRLKKQIAPHLKQLMGPWILGLCDQWNNSANAALAAFAEAFPPHKQRGAALFCAKESFSFLKDNVLLPPNNDPSLSKEEAEAQWENAVVTSLKGIAWIYRTVCCEEAQQTPEGSAETSTASDGASDSAAAEETIVPLYRGIVREAKFWELAKRKKNPPVVGAWFSLMLSILTSKQSSAVFEAQEISKLLKTTVNALDGDDPSLTPPVWSCLVHFLTSYEDWHVHVNPESVIVPKFLCFLRNGGRGSSISVYRYVPKIFAVLRSHVADPEKFTNEFLKNLRLGLFSQRVAVSPMETEAVSRSVFDTVEVITGEFGDAAGGRGVEKEKQEDERRRLRDVTSCQLAVLVDEAICEARNESCAESVAAGVGRLLSTARGGGNDDDIGLWARISPAFERVARAGPAKARRNLARFLVELKRPSAKRTRGGRGVRFRRGGEEQTEVQAAPAEVELPSFVIAGVAAVVDSALETLHTTEDAGRPKLDAEVLELVSSLVEAYSGEAEFRPGGGRHELFRVLLNCCTLGSVTASAFAALFSLLDADSDRALDPSWGLLSSMLGKRENRRLAEEFIIAAVKLRGRHPAASHLLTDDRISPVLVDCADELVNWAMAEALSPEVSESREPFGSETASSEEENPNFEADWKILTAVLTSAEDKPVISPVTVESIMSAFEAGLKRAAVWDVSTPGHRERVVAFVVRLCTALVPQLMVRMLMASPAPAERLLVSCLFLPADNVALAEDHEAVAALLKGVEAGLRVAFEAQDAGALFGPHAFLGQYISKLEDHLNALRRSDSTWCGAVIGVLAETTVLIASCLSDSDSRCNFLSRLVESALDGMGVDTVYDPSVGLSWAVSKGLPIYSGDPLSKACRERRMRMPAYSLFISDVLRRVTSRRSSTTEDPHGEATAATGIVSWAELETACGSSLPDLLAWVWSQSQYLSSLCQLWWQTPAHGWVSELNAADARLAANFAAMSEDPELPPEVKVAAFETVVTRALCPEDWIDSGLAALCLEDLILPERKRDVPQEIRSMIATEFAKYTSEHGNRTASIFHQIMAPLLLKDQERLDALGKYVSTLEETLSSAPEGGADSKVLAENLAGALKVYGVPLGMPDVESTRSLLAVTKKVWDSHLRQVLDKGLDSTTPLNTVNLHLMMCAVLRKIVASWSADWDPEFVDGFEFIFTACSKWLMALGVDFKTGSWSELKGNDFVTLTVATVLCDLIASVANLMRKEVERTSGLSAAQKETHGLPSVTEKLWLVVSDAIYSYLFSVFVNVAQSVPSVEEGGNKPLESGLFVAVCDTFVESLSGAVACAPLTALPADFVSRLTADLMPALLCCKRPIQEASFRVLKKILVSIASNEDLLPSVTLEKAALPSEDGDPDEEDSGPTVVRHPPVLLLEKIRATGEVVDVMLMDFPLADGVCTVQPFTDSYTYAMGYLKSWQLFLSFWAKLSTSTKDVFTDIMRFGSDVFPWSIFGAHVLERLLDNLLRLMPPAADFAEPSPRRLALASAPVSQAAGPGKDDVGPMMTTGLHSAGATLASRPCSDDVAHYACRTYLAALEAFPTLARCWYTAMTNARVQNAVDRFTSRHVTPLIWAAELAAVNAELVRRGGGGKNKGGEGVLNDATIKARENVREVVISHSVDESMLEMVFHVPPNYPLTHVRVDAGKRFGVSKPMLSKMLMQLGVFLAHRQRATIVEAIHIWKRSLDRRFEGVEECYICYTVVHGSTNQLPNRACRTCKKKFHGACVAKWFQTSHNTSCPLCRERFV